jgi:hypothetical protein
MPTSDIPTPELFQQESGGWIAVTGPGQAVRLAVAAPDRQTAQSTFDVSARRWLELIATAEAERA